MSFHFKCRRHKSLTKLGNPPAAGSRDFSYEAADVEALKDARDPGAEFLLNPGVRGRIKGFADIGVTEAVQTMLTGRKRPEDLNIFLGGRIKAAIGALVMGDAAGAGAEKLLGFTWVVNDRARLEVTRVSGESDFGITIEAGDALGHRKPSDDSFAFTIAMPASEKAIRMIGRRYLE